MSARTTMMERLPAQHEDLIHDVQLDYYGKRLASAGSDRRVKIFDVGADGQRVLTADLTGHEGPVWMLAWAHPEYGPILASCSYDRQVIVWKEHAPAQWSPVHKFLGHEGSVNAIAFCPREYGLRLACASSDENVSVLTYHGEGYWSSVMFKAHKTGCNAVAWRPDAKADATQDGMRLLTGGCDNLIKIWRYEAASETWVTACELPPFHTDWVRGVAWAPSADEGGDTIASCSQDKTVAVWTEGAGGAWASKVIELSCVVWSVSWSLTGRILAVAAGDNQVTLWKENALGDWLQIGQLSEDAPPSM